MTLKAYVDGSGNGSDLLVLAGYVAPADKWAKYSDDWNKMLECIPAMDCFKMMEMAKSEDRLEKAGWFYRIIEANVDIAFSCTMKQIDVVNAIRSIDWPDQIYNVKGMENPYFFAFHAMVNVLLQHHQPLNITQPVDFIFDEETEKIHTIAGWEALRESSSPDVSALMGKLSYDNEKIIFPLQAADLFAWWVRKWEMEDIKWTANLPFPWENHKTIPGLHMRFSEADLRSHLLNALKDPAVLERAARFS